MQMADTLLNIDFPTYIHDCQTDAIVAQLDESTNEELGCNFIPTAWNIDREHLKHKIEELLSDEWVARVREGFTETLNTALQQ